MGIAVQNITATSATVSWAWSSRCAGSFYSIMYHPSWNGLLLGYTRNNFLREAIVPSGQTTTSLDNLSPQTSYVLCVACRAARAAREQCQVFHTLEEGGSEPGSGKELALGIWLASTILLLLIGAALLYSCLHSWCHWSQDSPRACCAKPAFPCIHYKGDRDRMGAVGQLYTPSSSQGDPQMSTIIENPYDSTGSPSLCDPSQESVPLTPQAKSEGSP